MYPDMIKNGVLTEAGQEVIDYMDDLLAEAGRDVEKLNRLPGHVKHYQVQVKSMKLSPVEFVEAFGRSSVRYAYDDMVHLRESEAQADKVDDTADATNQLTEALAELREELGGQIADLKKENSTLKGQMTKLKKQLKESAEDVEDETEEEDSDDKPEESTPEDHGEDAGESDEYS
jgi:regulator of replication initiation timing